MEPRSADNRPIRLWPQAAYRDPFPGIRRIGVLRGGGLGDLIFTLPAIAALSAAYPGSSITLLGTEVHRSLVAACGTEIDDVEVLPASWDRNMSEASDAAVSRLQGRRFDLLVQLHGGGRESNPFVKRLGAAHTIGCATPDAAKLERNLPYEVSQPEVLRWLEVAALAGAQPVVLEPVLHAKAETGPEPGGTGSTLAKGSRPANEPRRVVVHAGASDPRRRWPSRCFAEVAANVAREGYDVIIIGGAEDTLVADDVRDRARRLLRSPVADPVAAGRISAAAGRLTLSDVVYLLAHAAAFLGNDSGPRHLAQALGCPTVAVFWGPNAINAAPFSRSHHRIHLGWRTVCPLCGAVSALGTERCAHDVSYVDDVSPEAVYEDLSRLLIQ